MSALQQSKNICYLLSDRDFTKKGNVFTFEYNGSKLELEYLRESFKDTAKKIYNIEVRQYDNTLYVTNEPCKVKKLSHHKAIGVEVISQFLRSNF